MALTPVIIIPARMSSTRLPGKPLADIAGKPMIIHVAERSMAANLGPVLVATDDERVYNTVKAHGFDAIMTASTHESGSDRIFEALEAYDPENNFDTIINVQGDLPTIEPSAIISALAPLKNDLTDIGTLGVEITHEEEKTNPNVVKIVGSPLSATRLRALYFTRATAPYGPGPLYHHIGLYAYRRNALTKFVKLSPSPLEKREKLEQLRALENQMRIDVELINTVPLGVDTEDDLTRARILLKA